MEIVWYGLNCFRLMERGMASIVTDPHAPDVGLTLSRPRADIVTVSRDAPECSYTRGVRGPFRVLDTPGEYEIGGVFITAIATYADKKKGAARGLNTIFHFDYNGLTICHLGHLGHVPTQAQIEALGTVDILLVPVGGDGGLTPAEASEVISLLEPAIVIPMRYKIPGVTLSLGTLKRFLKQMGIEKVEPQESLKVGRGRLPSETEIVSLIPRLE
ncbi:MAG TPA: lactamase [Anaerolineales bacterium]|nr:lactamase [Anaerolineae bacterium]HIQ02081.1 lactamase [Anaerolineales bacterium]